MKILDRYLWTSTLQGIAMAWVALVVLDVFFAFIDESRKTDALYSTTQAIIYLVYTLPGRFYELFPTATLIGTLLGLGNLAANSEFTAMRAAGISIGQIVASILKLGALFAIGIFIVGEWLVPAADLQARNFKAHLKNKNIVLVGGAGLWVKERNSIIHIGKVINNTQLADLSVYTFKEDHSALATITSSDHISIANNTWTLNNVVTTSFGESHVNKNKQKTLVKKDFLNAQILDVATVDPEQLSSSALNKIIKHQEDNNLKSDKYKLVYWKRFSVPFSALVMLILAMPFLFGSNRGGGAGQRVFIGIVIGIVFSLLNRIANELGIIYGLPAMLSAFLPSLLFFTAGIFYLKRIR